MEPATATHTNGAQQRDDSVEARPVDYAALNALWISLVAGLVVGSRGRASKDPIQARELIPLGAATFAISKAVARERIGSWVREPFVDQSEGQRPKGRRLRRAVGELVTCTRCVGTWSALGVVGLRVVHPEAGRTVSVILASSAANDWMQAGFKLLTEQTNLIGSKLPPRD
ncbi:MAG: hypothetical protein QOJ29_980 [Thermoleophilaceae bacterium]|nr:hypothetical protein [Thermoleophilaceae bacterium]